MIEALIFERVVLPLVVIAVPALLTWILRLLVLADKDRRANAEASRALLYDKLKHLCEKHIHEGICSIEDRKNLECLYQAYHDLHGNGFISRLYEQAMALPIERKEQT